MLESQVDTIIRDSVIEETADVGLYGVKFFVNGKWLTIIIDDYFPCVPAANGEWRPIFASTKIHRDQVQKQQQKQKTHNHAPGSSIWL